MAHHFEQTMWFAMSVNVVSVAGTGGATKRQARTSGEVQVAIGGEQPSSRTTTSTFVKGGTGGTLPEHCHV